MPKALIIYYSRTGNTERMAELFAEGVRTENIDVTVKTVSDVKAADLLQYDGIAMGSPTYYGSMAWELKKLIDDSVEFHGRLDGKVGAAFSSSANIGGGNETTILDILHTMIIHGMIIQGDPSGDHYGRVSIETPDARVKEQCKRAGVRFGQLLNKVAK